MLQRWRYSYWIGTFAADAHRVLLGPRAPMIFGAAALIHVLTISHLASGTRPGAVPPGIRLRRLVHRRSRRFRSVAARLMLRGRFDDADLADAARVGKILCRAAAMPAAWRYWWRSAGPRRGSASARRVKCEKSKAHQAIRWALRRGTVRASDTVRNLMVLARPQRLISTSDSLRPP